MDDIHAGKNIHKTLRIQLLGGFSVSVDGHPIPEEQWKSRRGRSLVKLLALAPAHRLHRDQVIDSLWPDSDLAAAANNFHQTLHAARRVLEPAGAGVLLLEEGFLSLAGGKDQAIVVDVEQFETAAARAKDSQDPALVQAALDFYQDDLLPDDLYEEWTIQRRETLKQTYLNLLLRLAWLLEEHQEYSQATETLLSLLAVDKVNEEAHIQLMRVYALSGQRHQALRQYQSLCKVLRADLDIEPSEPASSLYEAIQSNHFPPAAVSASAADRTHNLPAQLTSFIGREQEIGEVCQQVRQQRLVTLTGSGGTGKTRLALRAAGELLEHFPDGVWLVELAPIADPELVAQEIASRLGLQKASADSYLAILVNYLRGKKLLLLDNCEHLLDACARLAEHLLQRCPQISLLTTSREALGIAGETAYRVPSLAAPDPQRVSAPAELAQAESVRLFAERAAAVQSGFSLTAENLPAVGRICHRLDGIPLAIELAAARVGVLSVEQIAAHLNDRFHLLTGGSRTALPRQRTLRASIDWSYSLLSEPERLLLQRLSVFSGGWSLEAAEAVCAGDGLDQYEILDALCGLVNKSLVAADSQAGSETRYRMLETIRQYGQERLEDTGEGAAIRSRHLAYFAGLTPQAEPHLRGKGMLEWLSRLDDELANLRLALEWSLTGGVELGLQIMAGSMWFWWIRGLWYEGAGWLDKLLAAEAAQRGGGALENGRALQRARGLRTLQMLVQLIAPERRLSVGEESIAILRRLGPAGRHELGISLLESLDYYYGWRLNPPDEGEILEILRQYDDRFYISQYFFYKGSALLDWQSEFKEAETLIQQSLAIKLEIGDIDGMASLANKLAIIAGRTGRYARAEDLLRKQLKATKGWATAYLRRLCISNLSGWRAPGETLPRPCA